jgi:RNA 2',3'-cyclic 3'-phosphodiesterase
MESQDQGSMRLFFALWPDPETRNRLRLLQARVHGRLIHHDDLHLTLIFVGQQPQHAVTPLKDALARLQPREFGLDIDRLGYFARNRIAWAGSHATPAPLAEMLAELKQGLAAIPITWTDETRGYTPHITLARDAQAPLDPIFEPFVWKAREVALVRSMNRPGPRYEVLARRRLDEVLRVPDPREDAKI